MKPGYNVEARKRAVNLMLNEDLRAHVREVTPNLSGVVESLLAEYLVRERQRRAAQAKIVESTASRCGISSLTRVAPSPTTIPHSDGAI
jgi:antitoxin CcdA